MPKIWLLNLLSCEKPEKGKGKNRNYESAQLKSIKTVLMFMEPKTLIISIEKPGSIYSHHNCYRKYIKSSIFHKPSSLKLISLCFRLWTATEMGWAKWRKLLRLSTTAAIVSIHSHCVHPVELHHDHARLCATQLLLEYSAVERMQIGERALS